MRHRLCLPPVHSYTLPHLYPSTSKTYGCRGHRNGPIWRILTKGNCSTFRDLRDLFDLEPRGRPPKKHPCNQRVAKTSRDKPRFAKTSCRKKVLLARNVPHNHGFAAVSGAGRFSPDRPRRASNPPPSPSNRRRRTRQNRHFCHRCTACVRASKIANYLIVRPLLTILIVRPVR